MEAPARIQGKKLGSPEEVRWFDKGRMDVVTLQNVTVGRAVFEPGWKKNNPPTPGAHYVRGLACGRARVRQSISTPDSSQH